MKDFTQDDNFGVVAELVEQLEQDLLTLEESVEARADTTDLVHRSFRTAHNLKSSFGLLKREASSRLIHAIESNFDAVRNGLAELSPKLLHLSLLAVDALRFSVFLPEEREEDLERLRRELEQLLESERPEGKTKELAPANFTLSPRQRALVERMQNEKFRFYRIEKVIIPAGMTERDYETLPVYDDVREIGIHIATEPAFEALPKDGSEAVIRILIATTFPEEELGLHIFDTIRPVRIEQTPDSERSPDELRKARLQRELDEKVRWQTLGDKSLNILIAEDDFVSRTVINEILSPFGTCDLAADGREASEAFAEALRLNRPYDLVCLDIMMPLLDGTQVLAEMRRAEEKKGLFGKERSKIIMTTALDNIDQVFTAFRLQCDAYLIKPISKSKVLNQLRKLRLIEK
jgi:two-component system chemotaxis response regulator CheY